MRDRELSYPSAGSHQLLPCLGAVALIACTGRTADPPKPEPIAASVPGVFAPADAREPPSQATAMAAYRAKQWDWCAEQFLALAKASRRAEQPDLYYSAACCYAQGGKLDPAFSAMDRAIAAGLRAVDHVQKDQDLIALRGDPRWPTMIAGVKNSFAAWEQSLGAPELRRELLALIDEDQAARMVYIEKTKRGERADWGLVVAVDQKSSKALRRAIAQYGWPGKSVVGADAAHAGFELAQHASHDLALQKDVLARMKPMVDTGEVAKIDYAYLEDRVAVAEHRKQRYGTQFKGRDPYPIEDEPNVDARRKEIGLNTMAEYQQELMQMYDRQEPAAPPKK